MGYTKIKGKILDRIICEYKNGIGLTELSVKYHTTKPTLKKLFLQQGIRIRTRSEAHRLYTINENAFENINEQSAYWIGFITADGNLFERQKYGNYTEYVIQIGLARIDENHLKLFNKFVNTDRPIQRFIASGGHDASHISINSKKIYQDLQKYGLGPRKSLNCKISDDLTINPNFWRGMIDGDGSISDNAEQPSISLCGSHDIIAQFQIFLRSLNIEHKQQQHSLADIGIISVTSQSNCKLLLENLDYSKISLARKKERAKHMLKRIGLAENGKSYRSTVERRLPDPVNPNIKPLLCNVKRKEKNYKNWSSSDNYK